MLNLTPGQVTFTDGQVAELQKVLNDIITKNREQYEIPAQGDQVWPPSRFFLCSFAAVLADLRARPREGPRLPRLRADAQAGQVQGRVKPERGVYQRRPHLDFPNSTATLYFSRTIDNELAALTPTSDTVSDSAPSGCTRKMTLLFFSVSHSRHLLYLQQFLV